MIQLTSAQYESLSRVIERLWPGVNDTAEMSNDLNGNLIVRVFRGLGAVEYLTITPEGRIGA
jgi:hypothetical protein